ncbi:MAG: ParB/RepB/Spo0J family partition protein [Candidatus Rickettsiella isopodorum]|jgi:ParB family chromosome partitioning protein
MVKKSFKIRGNLAEALDDTVSSAKNNAGELHIEVIPLRKISLDPDNPRDLALSFEDLYSGITNDDHKSRKLAEIASLDSMVKSIIEQGVINPIVVYKNGDQYRLIAGERRTLASILAKKEDIPSKVLTAKPDPLKLSLLQWIENIEREDLTLWERLRNLEKIAAAFANKQNIEITDITPTTLSTIVGCSLQQAVNYRHLINASPELKKYIKKGGIKNIEKAAFISKSSVENQETLIQACIEDATLSELKKLEREFLGSPKSILKGRSSMKVNFGFTTNIKVAKVILDSVLKHKEFHSYSQELGTIQWDNHKSITNAFKQLIKLLEHA